MVGPPRRRRVLQRSAAVDRAPCSPLFSSSTSTFYGDVQRTESLMSGAREPRRASRHQRWRRQRATRCGPARPGGRRTMMQQQAWPCVCNPCEQASHTTRRDFSRDADLCCYLPRQRCCARCPWWQRDMAHGSWGREDGVWLVGPVVQSPCTCIRSLSLFMFSTRVTAVSHP